MRTLNIFAGVIFIAIIIYGVYAVRGVVSPPFIEITSPIANSEVFQNITLSGSVKNYNYISINDKRVLPKKDGTFQQELLLPVGNVVIKVYTKNKLGRDREILIPLFVKQ